MRKGTKEDLAAGCLAVLLAAALAAALHFAWAWWTSLGLAEQLLALLAVGALAALRCVLGLLAAAAGLIDRR